MSSQPATLAAQPQHTTHGFVPLPFFLLPAQRTEIFSPALHLTEQQRLQTENERIALLSIAVKQRSEITFIPREEDCVSLWNRFDMLDNIRAHCRKVAELALAIANLAVEQGANVMPEAAYAAGLLHDLGKTFTIRNGGNHAQLGASWVMRETRNGAIAQAVLYHVHWPWEDIIEACVNNDAMFTTMVIAYADKRVMHDSYTSLTERFADLQKRYGSTEFARVRIKASEAQGKQIEAAFSRRFGIQLDEYIADNGRLVKRT